MVLSLDTKGLRRILSFHSDFFYDYEKKKRIVVLVHLLRL